MLQICVVVRRKRLKWPSREIIEGTISKSVCSCTRRKLRTCRKKICSWLRSASRSPRIEIWVEYGGKKGCFGQERLQSLHPSPNSLISQPLLHQTIYLLFVYFSWIEFSPSPTYLWFLVNYLLVSNDYYAYCFTHDLKILMISFMQLYVLFVLEGSWNLNRNNCVKNV